MKERPILFSAPMVRALLDGSKTQTRRVVRKQFAHDATPAEVSATTSEGWQTSGHSGQWWDDGGACIDDEIRCPYGIPGDKLYVKESIRRGYCGDMQLSSYAADGFPTKADAWPWKLKTLPAMFCPRGLSRITLEITGVRIERLQDISEVDAKAEGVLEWASGACAKANPNGLTGQDYYELLWSQINGRQSWDANPWVWVIEFRRVPA